MNKVSPFIFAILLIMAACTKDETEPKATLTDNTPSIPSELTIENSPSARAEDDNKSSGIYKGTFVGSSGSFKLIIQNDLVGGVISVDGVSHQLTPRDFHKHNISRGLTNLGFIDDSDTIILFFSVDADGSNPEVTLQITGHGSIHAAVYKEKSGSLIKSFEGKYYINLPNTGRKEIWNMNLLLGNDSSATMVMNLDSTMPLNNGNNGGNYNTFPVNVMPDWFYKISNDKIIIYEWGQESGNPNLVFSPFMEENTNLVDNVIYGQEIWTNNSINYVDSVRLTRKI